MIDKPRPGMDIQNVVLDVSLDIHQRLGARSTIDEHENLFVDEIGSRGIHVSRRQSTTLSFNGSPVRTFLADVLLEDRVMVEFKSIPAITSDDLIRFAQYLKSLGFRRGLLINLSGPELDYRQLDLGED